MDYLKVFCDACSYPIRFWSVYLGALARYWAVYPVLCNHCVQDAIDLGMNGEVFAIPPSWLDGRRSWIEKMLYSSSKRELESRNGVSKVRLKGLLR